MHSGRFPSVRPPRSAVTAAVRLAAATVPLPDGRRLACTALGPSDGLPLVQLHGAIGTRPARCPWTEQALEDAGVRLLLPQRPGFGGSDPHPGRTLRSFAEDLGALADALGLARFAVLGVSAGGPYAAACAHRLGERVAVTALISTTVPLRGPGAAPAATPLLALGARTVRHPRAARAAARALVAAVRARPDALIGLIERRGAAADRAHLTPERREQMTAAILDAVAGGPDCVLEDLRLALGPWGFSPAAVPGPVLVWHGRDDATVPVGHALAHTATIRDRRTTVLPGDGHFFLRARLPAVLAAVRAAWSPVAAAPAREAA
ncbi:alpha/beta hydrolase [Paraconexibacter algicola]|uniref:Alpha/beta hydrolase n=1 Tax=Paraconexibacter algicola TaxID=2133960 RepID=A0A2T4UFK0_9ACTN|nr:alpha/beta hydrolase [Paraconexibacter algicola]